jgi:hypothetical protein
MIDIDRVGTNACPPYLALILKGIQMNIDRFSEAAKVTCYANSQAGTRVINRDVFMIFGRNWRSALFMPAQAMRKFYSVLFQKPMHPVLIAVATALLLAGSLYASEALAQVSGLAATAQGKKACEVVNQPEAQAALGEAVKPGEPLDNPSGEFSTCTYTGTYLPSTVGITLYRLNQGAELQYSMILKDIQSNKSAVALKGLGTEAHVWFEGDNGTIAVKNGSNVILMIGIQHGVYRPDQWQKLKRVSVESLRTLAEAAIQHMNQSK